LRHFLVCFANNHNDKKEGGLKRVTQTEVLNAQVIDDDSLREKYLIFSVGDDVYGMEIRFITEIIGIQPITELPEMPEYIKGITNLRGKIIPVMDARIRLKKEVSEYNDRTCIIVLDMDDISLGLIVDSVSEVLNLRNEDIEPLPNMNKYACRFIKGIGKTGDGVKLLIDCKKLLSDEEIEELSSKF